MAAAKPNKHHINSFDTKCQRIFEWAHYRPHTVFHHGRYPLIGNWDAWKRLRERLEIQHEGRLPLEETDERVEHVLDVILFLGRDISKLNLVRTDMYTIVFADRPLVPFDNKEWFTKLTQINGTIVTIDCSTPNDDIASGEHDREWEDVSTIIQDETDKSFSEEKHIRPPYKPMDLIGNEKDKSNSMDVLSVIFDKGCLSNYVGEYFEYRVRKVMKACKAIIYNENIKDDHIPDGYYLCNKKSLDHLSRYFHDAPHIFYTEDTFHLASADIYILLALEIKVTFHTFDKKLYENSDYYIVRSAPHPIRNLLIIDGGIVSRTCLFLINHAMVDLPGRTTAIDQQIYSRSHELGQILRSSHTHIVYMPSFSAETFRQEPLTLSRLKFLCELVQLQQQQSGCSKKKVNPKVDSKESDTKKEGDPKENSKESDTKKEDDPKEDSKKNDKGSCPKKLASRRENRKTKKAGTKKKMFAITDRFMEKFVSEPRSSINDRILLRPENQIVRPLLCLLEKLALGLVKERYQNVSKVNRNIQLPYFLTSHAQDLRSNERKKSDNTQTAVTPKTQKDSLDAQNTSQIIQRPPFFREAMLQSKTDGVSETRTSLDEIDKSLYITALTQDCTISFGSTIQNN